MAESICRQEDYNSLLRETNQHLKNISTEFSRFVAIYAAVHNVQVVDVKPAEQNESTAE